MCWLNSGSTNDQKNACNTAFTGYIDIWRQSYGQETYWSTKTLIAYTGEARYWANLKYNEFVSQWNNPSVHSSNSGSNLQSTGSVMIVQGATVAMLDSPLPGLADIPGWLWAIAGLCVAGLGVLAYPSGSIAIPQRQPYDFAQSRADATAVPIPLDRDIPATPTQKPCQPRGGFVIGTNNINLLGRMIPDGTITSLNDAVQIADNWMGCRPWIESMSDPDVLFSADFSPDDAMIHSLRITDRDVNAPRPHFNLEAGFWSVDFGRHTSRFNSMGNLHLYFV